jgi:hypothetical protein
MRHILLLILSFAASSALAQSKEPSSAPTKKAPPQKIIISIEEDTFDWLPTKQTGCTLFGPYSVKLRDDFFKEIIESVEAL